MTPETVAKMITAYIKAYESSQLTQKSDKHASLASMIGSRAGAYPQSIDYEEAHHAGEKAAIAASAA